MIPSRKNPVNSGAVIATMERVIPTVGRFGEGFCASILGGENVSEDPAFRNFADVFVHGQNVAVEAKMSNQNHVARSDVKKIERLHGELGQVGFPFDIKKGVYALIFYKGEKKRIEGVPRKSTLLSRKLSESAKRVILAGGIQFVYMIDVCLMRHLALGHGHNALCEVRPKSRMVEKGRESRLNYQDLCLGRTFLRGFVNGSMTEKARATLKTVFGEHGWSAIERDVSVKFQNGSSEFERSIPVRIVGSRSTVWTVANLLRQSQGRAMSLGGRNMTLKV